MLCRSQIEAESTRPPAEGRRAGVRGLLRAHGSTLRERSADGPLATDSLASKHLHPDLYHPVEQPVAHGVIRCCIAPRAWRS